MTSRSSFSPRERSLRSRLHLLLNQADALIHGSLIEMNRKCGNPKCRCASNVEHRHRSLYLGQSRAGKKSMVYIPDDLVPEVRQAVEYFQQALDLLEEINIEARLRLQNKKAKRKAHNKQASRKTSSSQKKKPPGSSSSSTPKKRPKKS